MNKRTDRGSSNTVPQRSKAHWSYFGQWYPTAQDSEQSQRGVNKHPLLLGHLSASFHGLDIGIQRLGDKRQNVVQASAESL